MNTTETGRSPIVAYATLVRLPNLFTSPPDVILGAALVTAATGPVSLARLSGLAVASVLLYAAGTTLNDYFDAAEDARERPERPIPSGDVSRRGVLGIGVALLGGGVALAFAAAGVIAGVVAGVLALTVLLYDGLFKGTAIGFLFMGTSRGLNVLLGATVGTDALVSFPSWGLAVLAVVVLYIASVTYMAESETGEGGRREVLSALAGVAIAALGVVIVLFVRTPTAVETGLSILLLTSFLVWVGRPLRAAYADPAPDVIGPAVGACVLGLTILDAAFAAISGPAWAFVALAFVIPSVGLSRVFDVT